MALSKLDNLYRQVILDHSSHPHHRGTLNDTTQKIEMNNPTCGDVIELQLEVEDGIIKDIAFDGSGCSISTASASMMTDAVIGKPVAEAEHLAVIFAQMVQGNEIPEEDNEALGDAAMLSGVAKFPARIKCSTLAWKALGKALTDDEGKAQAGQFHKE
ncbi:Fe-S cluster assembly sulfur transfer protein SufU [Enterococcus sp. CSURQ0835]|uniref:Fe-S cluster assembly sulfur transfer protein SufU n=1 Tax=Enterococcus sp. CSURQ0835 TaxID=2681394 RepID=UPI0013587D98|nr:SUF system NifU family Fe-S cluster assembly protein [Enterococcus sp. CSURQ0835]